METIMKKKKKEPKFIQLTVHKGQLYALDEHGGVWIYFNATANAYAKWVHLTKWREDKTNETQ